MAIRSTKPTTITNAATSFSGDFDFLGDVTFPHLQGFSSAIGDERMASIDARVVSIDKLIVDLADPDRREKALQQLVLKRAVFGDLALRLWFSFGTTAILLQEVTSVYPLLSASALTLAQSKRVGDALVLLQFMAAHLDTRKHFLEAYIPMYLHPLLNTSDKTNPYEFLRLTTLGVIGALVKDPDTETILFLLASEIMPLCLHTMEIGSDLSRQVATFILLRILLDDVGMDYVCHTLHRLYALNQALGNVVAEQPSHELLNLVIRCYLRFSEDERSLWVLRHLLPKRLIDGTFNHYLWVDETMRVRLQQLLNNVRRPALAQEAEPNISKLEF